MTSDERQKMYFPMFAAAALLLVLNVSKYSYGVITALHWDNWVLEYFVNEVAAPMNAYRSQYTLKAYILICLCLMQVLKAGKTVKTSWKRLLIYAAIALLVFLFPIFRYDSYPAQVRYFLTTIAGFVATGHAISLIGRKMHVIDEDLNDINETFDQCGALVETEDSFNLKTRYQYRHRMHTGWINIVNPFRAMMVTGTPGSGKSYSFFNPVIEQSIKKGYTMFCYDYKFPTLSEIVYNTFLENRNVYRDKYSADAKFCVINFNDPLRTMRCNPIHRRYITDPADTSEIAEIIMNNLAPESIERPDFFSRSGTAYIDLLILYLWHVEDGKYCTVPHLIELMTRDYRELFNILMTYDITRTKLSVFRSTLKDKAMEQLQGQLASAMIPLLRFASPALYWVLSGDDFPLDINNPLRPEIVCVGNDPDRQNTYKIALSLITSRLFRQINHPKKLKSLVLFDELPTVFIRDLDNVIATARSNKVFVMLGAQDKTQLIRDYSDKNAKVIFNTVGNRVSGQVNGETAKDFAEQFGREFRLQQSETTGGENDTTNRSYHQQDILTRTRIETLPQGMFFGTIADDFDVRSKLSRHDAKEFEKKLFCGNIIIDNEAFRARKKKWVPIPPTNPQLLGVIKRAEEETRDHAEDEMLTYLIEKEYAEEKEKKNNDEEYTMPGPNTIEMEATEALGKMNKEQKEELLKKVIEKRQGEAVDRAVQNNYDKIRQDIDNLFQMEQDRMLQRQEGVTATNSHPDRTAPANNTSNPGAGSGSGNGNENRSPDETTTSAPESQETKPEENKPNNKFDIASGRS